MELWSHPGHAAESALRERLETLSRMTHFALCSLPSHTTEEVVIEGRNSRITTYRENLEDGRVQVVVQAYIPRGRWLFFRSADVLADGFHKRESGGVDPLPDKLRYGFM